MLAVLWAILFFCVLQWIAVLGRVYVRVFIVKAFGKDDVACLVTLVFATAFDVLLLALWPLSGLQAIGAFPIKNIVPTVNIVLAILLLYIIGTMFLKIALGLLLLRVLVKRWMKLTIYGVMAVSVVYSFAFFFVVLFQCGNPQKFAYRIAAHQCLDVDLINGLSYTHAALVALADVTYAMLPVLFLWNAAFSLRAKLSVGGILLLGSVGCVCTFIRLGWVRTLSGATPTYLISARTIGWLSSLELAIGLMCISFATYRPLLHKIFRRDRGSYYFNDSHDASQFRSQNALADEMTVASPHFQHARLPLESYANGHGRGHSRGQSRGGSRSQAHGHLDAHAPVYAGYSSPADKEKGWARRDDDDEAGSEPSDRWSGSPRAI